jgi:hypothetical protein
VFVTDICEGVRNRHCNTRSEEKEEEERRWVG